MLLEIQNKFKERLAPYVGCTNITPAVMDEVQREFIRTMVQFAGTSEAEFELTAQQVRYLGYDVPPQVPESATGKFKLARPRQDTARKDVIVIPLIQTDDWRWIDLTFQLGK